jgi:preprotein translocase subunit SecY
MNNSDSVKLELKNKILFTVWILLVYRLGTFVPVPGIDTNIIKKLFTSGGADVFGMINLFSGGALERMSIFALNIMPYITSSIIMQLLTSMHKGLESLKKEGDYGRSKINQYTRYLTILLSLLQSIGVYYALSNPENNAFISESQLFAWTTCVSLVGGTVMLMWFGEKITSSGIGNGISLIIFVGILSSLPSSFVQILDYSKTGVYSYSLVMLFSVAFLMFLIFVCFVEKCHKKVKIQYPGISSAKTFGSKESSFLPLKINISGVIPPIFASSILMSPIAIIQMMGYENLNIMHLLRRGGELYFVTYSILIVFFSYFYSSIVFNTEDVSSNLKKSGCFILGVRPGLATSKFLDSVVAKLTMIGSAYLIIICIVPEIIVAKYSVPLTIGGTGVLIIVNVVLDVVNQVQSYIISSRYGSVGQGAKRRRLRVRA